MLHQFFFFKQKTAYEIVSRDWSSDVCSSDLAIEDGACIWAPFDSTGIAMARAAFFINKLDLFSVLVSKYKAHSLYQIFTFMMLV